MIGPLGWKKYPGITPQKSLVDRRTAIICDGCSYVDLRG
jgi:hypothetical protein